MPARETARPSAPPSPPPAALARPGDRPHLSLPPSPSEPAYCRDFLFGFYCSPGPGGLVVGAPHFPFGDPLYEPAFITRREKKFQGVYGLVWQADHVVKTIEELLSRYVVHTRARPSGVTLADDTVLVYLSDNAYLLPRSKSRSPAPADRPRLRV